MVSFSTLFVATVLCISGSEAARLNPRTASELRYSRSHSLGNSYQFDARQGWEFVNITDLQYKYSRSLEATASTVLEEDLTPSLEARGQKSQPKSSPLSISDTIKHALNQAWKGLKGIGSLEQVKITWYVVVYLVYYPSHPFRQVYRSRP